MRSPGQNYLASLLNMRSMGHQPQNHLGASKNTEFEAPNPDLLNLQYITNSQGDSNIIYRSQRRITFVSLTASNSCSQPWLCITMTWRAQKNNGLWVTALAIVIQLVWGGDWTSGNFRSFTVFLTLHWSLSIKQYFLSRLGIPLGVTTGSFKRHKGPLGEMIVSHHSFA